LPASSLELDRVSSVVDRCGVELPVAPMLTVKDMKDGSGRIGPSARRPSARIPLDTSDGLECFTQATLRTSLHRGRGRGRGRMTQPFVISTNTSINSTLQNRSGLGFEVSRFVPDPSRIRVGERYRPAHHGPFQTC
jgi:hypothetical protein